MSYGSSEWISWFLGEEEGLKHIKSAYNAGSQTFDTADTYSNGLSEIIPGKAVNKFDFPRDEIVILTKLSSIVACTPGGLYHREINPEAYGYANQIGLNRKHIFDAVKHIVERLQLDCIVTLASLNLPEDASSA